MYVFVYVETKNLLETIGKQKASYTFDIAFEDSIDLPVKCIPIYKGHSFI